MKKIGITTTIPSEVIFAAGAVPVDLNNLFISSWERRDFIRKAERDGYPRNVCGWIKGIYGGLLASEDIDCVVAVTQGDCSNTHALMETLEIKGVRTIPFAYPYDRDRGNIAREIERLAETLNTTVAAAEEMRIRMDSVRSRLDRLDELTWKESRVSGAENHSWLVSSSDFNGDIEIFERELNEFILEAEQRKPFPETARLACIGVPPILDDLHHVLDEYGGQVVLNEVQRQFSMPERSGDIVDQYLAYTYPYSIFHRLEFIQHEIKQRKISGIVHYVQSFCHRHIEDMVIREKIDIPMLTIEGENPGPVDERTRIRMQAFVEMLST